MKKNKRILFYSSVQDVSLFQTQRFYHIDITLLQNLNYQVKTTNKIGDYLKFWTYDAAFIYFYRYGFFAAFISRLYGKKVFFTGGIDALDKNIGIGWHYYLQVIFFKLCYLFANRCIIVSAADWQNIQKIYYRKKLPKLLFCPHTIDINNFSAVGTAKEKLFTTIVWMGDKENIIRKGVNTSLKLFAYLISKPEYKTYRFVIIGKKGEGTKYLQKLCKELKIENKVDFTDTVSETTKINILKKSSYYLQLSKYEGFGIAALEALAAQNIVIHSGQGGLKDTMRSYGIQVNLDCLNFETVYNVMLKFNLSVFDDLTNYLSTNFSNNNRQQVLQKILSE